MDISHTRIQTYLHIKLTAAFSHSPITDLYLEQKWSLIQWRRDNLFAFVLVLRSWCDTCSSLLDYLLKQLSQYMHLKDVTLLRKHLISMMQTPLWEKLDIQKTKERKGDVSNQPARTEHRKTNGWMVMRVCRSPVSMLPGQYGGDRQPDKAMLLLWSPLHTHIHTNTHPSQTSPCQHGDGRLIYWILLPWEPPSYPLTLPHQSIHPSIPPPLSCFPQGEEKG